MEVMKQLDQGEIAATARARLHGDMVHPRSEIQVSRPQAPRPMPPAMNPAFSYPGENKIFFDNFVEYYHKTMSKSRITEYWFFLNVLLLRLRFVINKLEVGYNFERMVF